MPFARLFNSLLVLFFFLSLLSGNTTCAASNPDSTPFSIAFFYASNPPLDELAAFDVAVVDPDAIGVSPGASRSSRSALFAYVSLGEAEPERKSFRKFDPAWFMAENKAWKSRVIDVSNPAWKRFFLDEVIEPLWKSGYRGFFLDTLDSYQLGAKKEDFQRMEASIAETILEIKRRHPDVRLILNRGFEVFDRVKGAAFAVAAESLYRNFDPATGKYGEVKETDRQWLMGKFAAIRKAGVPVISIDYVPPADRELARKTAEKISGDGIIPWVTEKDISSLGVGLVEVMPRRILGLYDGTTVLDPEYSSLNRFAPSPLNYLGYRLDIMDVRKGLPQIELAGRYAGIILWGASASAKVPLIPWLERQIKSGIKVLFLDGFQVPPAQIPPAFGLSFSRQPARGARITVGKKSDGVGFELPVSPNQSEFLPVRAGSGSEVLLQLKSSDGLSSDAIAVTPWGGYILSPFLLQSGPNEQDRWVTDPFLLFSKTLRLPLQPAPDVTTENGTRLLLTHIDGDGFESMAERFGGPISAIELRDRILDKYRIPTSFSIITGVIEDKGLYPDKAKYFQGVARDILARPWIEAASHTFSHPYYWQKSDYALKKYSSYNMPIPNYKPSMEAEIPGSVEYINRNLLSGGKKTTLLHWSGDCTPGVDALEAVYRAGVRNINGGDTLITETNKTLTSVAPLGIEKGGYYQIFAPNQNENNYTNLWKGPFYGFKRVIETFRLTDSPRRMKPINIYYHVYSASKEASIRALDDVYAWAMQQTPNPIFTSEYVDKVLDFNRTVIARKDNGWLLRNSGILREFRIPGNAGYPDLEKSTGIAGYSEHNDQRYIHVVPGGEAVLRLVPVPPSIPYLQTLQGELKSFDRTAKGIRIVLKAQTLGELTFGSAKGCTLHGYRGKTPPQASGDRISVRIAPGEHAFQLVCR